MKKAIERLAVGQVNEKRPTLTLYREKEAFKVEEDRVYEGSLTFMSDGELKGIITTSDYRMETEKSEFAGRDVDIAYRFDSTGLKAGDKAEGSFTLITNAGEYKVPFAAEIEAPYIEAETGRLKNLEDFAQYASGHGAEAFRIFRSSAFAKLIRDENIMCRELYQEYRRTGFTELSMEEFLIYAKKKKKVELTLNEYEKEWVDPVISMKSAIEVRKSSWGYVPVEIQTDGDFLNVEKDRITGEDFTGRYYELEYVVVKEKLHGGNNYGRIILKTPWQTFEYIVTVKNRGEFADEGEGRVNEAASRQKRKERRLVIRLLELYLEFRLKRLHKKLWTKESVSILEELRTISPSEEHYSLLEAQMFMAEGRKEEAGWLLNQFRNQKKKSRDREVQAYFLYLSTIYEAKNEYTQEVTEEIKKLYAQEKENCFLLWFLLYLDERLTGNREKKLKLIERQCRYQCHSSMLYLEACLLYQEDPSLLRELDDFSMRILEFAVRKDALTEELAGRAAGLAMKYHGYLGRLLRILAACQKRFPSKEVLTAVISLLMKGNRTDSESFHWYALGVAEDLRITRLYEYYMMSLDPSGIDRLPKTLLMYFSYNSQLEERKKAMLYDYVIGEEEEQPAMFAEYKNAISRFTVEQLLKGRINEYLVPVYRAFLTEEIMNDPLREALAEIVYSYEVAVDRTDISSVQVLAAGQEELKTAACTGKKAYVKLPVRDYVLIFVDTRGRRLTGSVKYHVKPLFEEKYFKDMCREFLPSEETVNSGGRIRSLENMMEEGHYGKVYEELKQRGMEGFPPKKAVKLAGRIIRELNYEKDRFLCYLGRYAFLHGYYDMLLLEYLAEQLQGSSQELMALWEEASSFDADTYGLSERILVQLLFSGLRLPGEEKIFKSYVEQGAGEMVKKAYVNDRSARFLVKGGELSQVLIEEMKRMYLSRGVLGDPGRLALLMYYSKSFPEDGQTREFLLRFMREAAVRGRYLACFQDYPVEFLRRAGVPPMQVIEYREAPDAKLKIQYKKAEDVDFITEDMSMPFPGIFVKCFYTEFGDRTDYLILKETDGETERLAMGQAENDQCPEEDDYSREALKARIRQCGSSEEKKRLMAEYERRKQMLSDVFRMI